MSSSLNGPSLLVFDNRRKEEPENLHTIYWYYCYSL